MIDTLMDYAGEIFNFEKDAEIFLLKNKEHIE